MIGEKHDLNVKGDPIKLYARTQGSEILAAGTEAVIIDESKDKKYYIIEKFNY